MNRLIATARFNTLAYLQRFGRAVRRRALIDKVMLFIVGNGRTIAHNIADIGGIISRRYVQDMFYGGVGAYSLRWFGREETPLTIDYAELLTGTGLRVDSTVTLPVYTGEVVAFNLEDNNGTTAFYGLIGFISLQDYSEKVFRLFAPFGAPTVPGVSGWIPSFVPEVLYYIFPETSRAVFMCATMMQPSYPSLVPARHADLEGTFVYSKYNLIDDTPETRDGVKYDITNIWESTRYPNDYYCRPVFITRYHWYYGVSYYNYALNYRDTDPIAEMQKLYATNERLPLAAITDTATRNNKIYRVHENNNTVTLTAMAFPSLPAGSRSGSLSTDYQYTIFSSDDATHYYLVVLCAAVHARWRDDGLAIYNSVNPVPYYKYYDTALNSAMSLRVEKRRKSDLELVETFNLTPTAAGEQGIPDYWQAANLSNYITNDTASDIWAPTQTQLQRIIPREGRSVGHVLVDSDGTEYPILFGTVLTQKNYNLDGPTPAYSGLGSRWNIHANGVALWLTKGAGTGTSVSLPGVDAQCLRVDTDDIDWNDPVLNPYKNPTNLQGELERDGLTNLANCFAISWDGQYGMMADSQAIHASVVPHAPKAYTKHPYYYALGILSPDKEWIYACKTTWQRNITIALEGSGAGRTLRVKQHKFYRKLYPYFSFASDNWNMGDPVSCHELATREVFYQT